MMMMEKRKQCGKFKYIGWWTGKVFLCLSDFVFGIAGTDPLKENIGAVGNVFIKIILMLHFFFAGNFDSFFNKIFM